jgi:hypothetical protein
MTDETTPQARPVSLAAIVWIFLLMSLFGLLTDRVYSRHRSAPPQNETAENLPKDMVWKATPETRREYLAELRKKQSEQTASYGWVDRKAGVVQVPIERAMELVVQEEGGAK